MTKKKSPAAPLRCRYHQRSYWDATTSMAMELFLDSARHKCVMVLTRALEAPTKHTLYYGRPHTGTAPLET
jgi:hypothetical protein